MRGTDLITRMITELQKTSRRSGQEISQANMNRLTAIHQKLADGHNSMEEAMRELAAFVAEKSPDDGTSDPPSSSDGFVDNLPAAEAGVDTADARSRSMARGATPRHPVRRLPSRLFTRPDLYRTGNHPVRSSSRTHRPR